MTSASGNSFKNGAEVYKMANGCEKYRNFAWTLFGFDEECEKGGIKGELLLEFLQANCKYYAYGLETCPNTQRLHWQGFCVFKTSRTKGGTINKTKHIGCHWEEMRKSIAANEKYCSKEGQYTEWGEKPQQGKRNDIISIRETLAETGKIESVIDQCTNVQQIRFAELYLKYREPKRTWKPNVYWFWGRTGAGKTRMAKELFPNAYISSRNLKWWEGYDGHEDVIIDDFRADFCTFHELLRLLDWGEFRVEVKGASRQLLARNMVITSCYHPDRVYNTREDIDQLIRRIDLIEYFSTDGAEEQEQRSGCNTGKMSIPTYMVTDRSTRSISNRPPGLYRSRNMERSLDALYQYHDSINILNEMNNESKERGPDSK